MISMFTKAQLQDAVDAMTDDPDDVVLADIWDRENACQFGQRPVLTPRQWIEFGTGTARRVLDCPLISRSTWRHSNLQR